MAINTYEHNLPYEIVKQIEDIENICRNLGDMETIAIWWIHGQLSYISEFRIWQHGVTIDKSVPYVKFGMTPSYTVVHRMLLSKINDAWLITESL